MPVCIGCGCTDDNACMTADGACHWVDLAPPFCSACAEADGLAEDGERGLVCAHSFLYVDTITARCVHCGEIKIDREAA